MKNLMFSFVFLSSFVILNPAFAGREKLGASQSSEINFDKGLATLSEGSKLDIKRAVEAAKTAGPIKQIKLVAWSDHEYPAAGDTPTKESKNLAAARADAISRYLEKDLKVGHIKIYNMAKRPNQVQELFQTSQALVKDNMEKTGAAPADFKELGMESKMSVAWVLIYTKDHPNKM